MHCRRDSADGRCAARLRQLRKVIVLEIGRTFVVLDDGGHVGCDEKFDGLREAVFGHECAGLQAMYVRSGRRCEKAYARIADTTRMHVLGSMVLRIANAKTRCTYRGRASPQSDHQRIQHQQSPPSTFSQSEHQ